jgi:hypothetical protein
MKIKIDLERYEQLLDSETRIHVLISKIKGDNYVCKEDVCRILGYERIADKLANKERKDLGYDED